MLMIALLSDNFTFTNPAYQWSSAEDFFGKVLTAKNLLLITMLWAILLYLYSLSNWLSGNDARKSATGFSIIYILAIFSLFIAGNKSINNLGIEYVVFALLIGLLLGNFFTLPVWIKAAARSEFFIKTGLVILDTDSCILTFWWDSFSSTRNKLMIFRLRPTISAFLSQRNLSSDFIQEGVVHLCGIYPPIWQTTNA